MDIESLVVPRARLMRLPELRAGDPEAPLLPDIDIDVGRLQVGRLLVDPAVTGHRHLLTLGGQAKIADGRAQVTANARALTRSEEHTTELQSLMRRTYAVLCS